MNAKHTAPETVKRHCGGAVNTDIMAGWEKGIGPRKKSGGRLFDHSPPEHLDGQRFLDWCLGYECGKKYRARYIRKTVHFRGYKASGEEVKIDRKGWGVSRSEVISNLEKMGCIGDVLVCYFEDGELIKTVNCGI